MNLQQQGYCFYPYKIGTEWLSKLKKASLYAIDYHKEFQLQLNGEVGIKGLALNSLPYDEIFIDFLEELFRIRLIEFIQKEYFLSKFILHSFSCLNNKEQNFSSKVHRDIKFYSGEIPLMLNCILMLDEFTVENGATMLLPESHKRKYQPSDQYFYEQSIRAVGGEGTILLFNSNIWHCAAANKTNKDRLAIAMTFVKSSMKQLMDYPRAIHPEKALTLSNDVRQLLGYDARVPENIKEWYSKDRTYKKDQD